VAKEKTPIDRIIEPALEKVAARRENRYFYKSEVLAEVLKHRSLKNMLDEMKAKWPDWKFDEVIRRYITDRVGQALQKRDANKIRVYECYGAGESERRWQPGPHGRDATRRNARDADAGASASHQEPRLRALPQRA
jgi:hypothetical protein